MAELPAGDIVGAIMDGLEQSYSAAVLVSKLRGNPKRFVVQFNRQTTELWIYIWTLTHGGGKARPENEYRIQITGIQSPIAQNPNGPTFLMGYEPNTGCFAGFDLEKHRTFSEKSPSIQVPITVLYQAQEYGLSFKTKTNDEIVIGIRPDQFFAYCLNASALHRYGADEHMAEMLTQATTLAPIAQADLVALAPERKRILGEVTRLARDSSFRKNVITAYDHRCAITGVQLRLIDAAHILPVGAPGSTDEVSNGVCLSPTYHRAFDMGLIYLNTNLEANANPERVRELQTLGLAGGLNEFEATIGKRILLPRDATKWPNPGLIHAANKFRGIG